MVGGSLERLSLPTVGDPSTGALVVQDSDIHIGMNDQFNSLRPEFSFSAPGPGTYTMTVPYGVHRIVCNLRGAGGGGGGAGLHPNSIYTHRDANGGSGGDGARLYEYIDVSPFDEIRLIVGQGGSAGSNRTGYNVRGASGSNGQSTRLYINNSQVLHADGGGYGRGGLQNESSGRNGSDASPSGGAVGGSRGTRSSQPTSGQDGSASLSLA